MHEVKVFDGAGKLKFVISKEVLVKRSTNIMRAMLSDRDRNQIIKFGDDPREKNQNFLDSAWYQNLSSLKREWGTDLEALTELK